MILQKIVPPFGAAWRGMALALMGAGLAGCNLGPTYHRPDVVPPAAWRQDAKAEEPKPTVVWPSAEWWHGFGSPRLDELMADARSANDDLAAAIARVREAEAEATVAGAALLPSVSAGFDATHERQKSSGASGLAAGGPPAGGAVSSHASTYTVYNPQLTASYELDFWGKNRAKADAAEAAAQASRYDRETVALTVMVNVATDYFQILELRDLLDVAEANLASANTTLKGLRLEREVGTATALDVAQQETTVATLNAAIPPLRQQLAQTVDALAILVGKPPEQVEVTAGTLADLASPVVQPGLPSELLARRPDVAEAEAQLIAANADIRAARAAFFPSIDLTAEGGFTSTALSTLFSPANRAFAIAGSVSQPIFDGGAIWAQYDYSKARYDELAANYHKAVISAFGNVEDALVALRQTTEQQRRQQNAVTTARHAYDIAQAQLHAGTTNILTVLNTENALFSAQDALVRVKFSRLQALVDLFQALGGGWQQA